MVAPHADIAASPFSPADSRLFHAWYLAKGDLALLSERVNTPIPTLLAWTQTPAIAAMIAAAEFHREIADRFHRSDTYKDAIDKLVHVLKTSKDLVEIRRAATTILRGPTQPRTRKEPASRFPILPAGRGAGEVAAVPPRPEGAPSLPPLPTLRQPAPPVAARPAERPSPTPPSGRGCAEPPHGRGLNSRPPRPPSRSTPKLLELVGRSSLDHLITSSLPP